MSHIENIREIIRKNTGGLQWYLRALKETEKKLDDNSTFVHDRVAKEMNDIEEAIAEGEK